MASNPAVIPMTSACILTKTGGNARDHVNRKKGRVLGADLNILTSAGVSNLGPEGVGTRPSNISVASSEEIQQLLLLP